MCKTKSYCENVTHNGKEILLEYYKDIDQGKLLICPECNELYYLNEDMKILARLREESFLISNIDSPQNNSIECKCGNLMYMASDVSNSGFAWYYCLNCNHMYYKSIHSPTSN